MTYKFSRAAQTDLNNLYDFGADTWGVAQADSYFGDLIAHIERIADDPKRYPRVDEMKHGTQRSVFRSHAIYFDVVDDIVEILAIVRSQDISRLNN